MTASLFIRSGEGEHFEFRLGATCTLGRHPEQDVQILDPLVSRLHAAIAAVDGHFWLQDRGSMNGTFLNGALLSGSQRLVDGDLIQIADTTIIFSDRCRAGVRILRDFESNDVSDPAPPFDRLSHVEFPSSSDDSCSGSVDG